jgi:hypothetical protein
MVICKKKENLSGMEPLTFPYKIFEVYRVLYTKIKNFFLNWGEKGGGRKVGKEIFLSFSNVFFFGVEKDVGRRRNGRETI